MFQLVLPDVLVVEYCAMDITGVEVGMRALRLAKITRSGLDLVVTSPSTGSGPNLHPCSRFVMGDMYGWRSFNKRQLPMSQYDAILAMIVGMISELECCERTIDYKICLAFPWIFPGKPLPTVIYKQKPPWCLQMNGKAQGEVLIRTAHEVRVLLGDCFDIFSAASSVEDAEWVARVPNLPKSERDPVLHKMPRVVQAISCYEALTSCLAAFERMMAPASTKRVTAPRR